MFKIIVQICILRGCVIFVLKNHINNNLQIKKKYTNTDKTILICSHMSVINMLINCFYGTKRFLESNINMGVVTTYENNQLIYLNQ